MSGQPYPVGTKVVLTWTDELQQQNGFWPGEVATITCGEIEAANEAPFCSSEWFRCQRVDTGDDCGLHPVAWLRPIEDPDPDTVEQHDEVTA